MIFITVGTQLPFDRLVAAVDAWAAYHPEIEIFGQIAEPGADGYHPRHFPWVPHLDPAAFKAQFEAADQIIAHAGMGTIISALSSGKPLLIMPRRAHLNEHRNEHQRATAQRFGTRTGIYVAPDETGLPVLLDRFVKLQGAGQADTIAPFADQRLTDALRDLILRR